jgi:hypothetical protein
MNPPLSFVLFADLFDRLRLQLPDPVVNWLTPVWILCVGATAGLILTALLWGLFWLISRIPGISTLGAGTTARKVAIGVLTAVLFAGLAATYLQFGEKAAAQPAAGAQAAAPAAQPAAAPARSSPVDRAWALGGCLVAAWLLAVGIVILSQPKSLAETGIAIREGVLWPLTVTALVMAGCSLFGLFIVRKPVDLLDSLQRWPELALRPEVSKSFPLGAGKQL